MTWLEGWRHGPWDDEADTAEWTSSGLLCRMRRQMLPHAGHLCGYVAVAEGHPLHGKGYSEHAEALNKLWTERKEQPLGPNAGMGVMLAALGGDLEKATADRALSCHGGVTFAGKWRADAEQDAGLWWFGFDCAHAGDLSPGASELGYEYRGWNYVKDQTELLAHQLAGLREEMA